MQIVWLDAEQIDRIAEVDRTETVHAKYVAVPDQDNMGIRLVRQEFTPPLQTPNWDANGVAARARWWRREIEDGGAFVAAVGDEGRLLGFGVVSPKRPHQNFAEVLAMFVANGHRSKGLGRRLLLELEQKARSRGIDALCVQSNSEVSSAEFYKKSGYRLKCLIDNSQVRFPESETAIILIKELR